MKQKGHVWAAALAVLLCMAFAVLTSAETPSWWVTVVDTNLAPNDFAPVLAGQLKWMATNAAVELETLPGGAGTGVHALVSGFTPSNNYVPINVGQLKNTAAPFYQRLMAVGYATNYPWSETTADDADFAPAVLGQLKYVFDFDVSTDSDDDDMPDWWELERGLNPFNATDAANDEDGDGFLNIYEFRYGSDPALSTSTPQSLGWIYVATNGSHTQPYDQWLTAATNIQTALDAATNSYAIICVADGIYEGPCNRNLTFPDHPVMLFGVDGAQGCVVDGQNADACSVFRFVSGSDSRTVLRGVTVRGGHQQSGFAAAGIACSNASPTVIQCLVTSNNGIGMSLEEGGDVRIWDSAIAANEGEGVFCVRASASIRGSLISDNASPGVDASENSMITLADTTVSLNGADGVRVDASSSLFAYDSCLTSNGSSGARASDNSEMTISNCCIVANGYAGCRISDGGWLQIVGGNIAWNSGRGVYCDDSEVDLEGTEISYNGDAAICLVGAVGAPMIRGALIEGNSVGLDCAEGAAPLIADCELVGNLQGMFFSDVSPTVQNCRVSATVYSGIVAFGGLPELRSSMIVDNGQDGVQLFDSSAEVVNCSILGNTGSALNCDQTSIPSVTGCILWSNALGVAGGFGWPEIDHSVVEGMWVGSGNTTNAPGLVPGSYRLQADSSCIDSAGTNDVASLDIDGEERWDHPDHSNLVSIVDRGADEFVDRDSDQMADAWEVAFFGSTNSDGNADADNDGLDNASEYADGTNPTNSDSDADMAMDGAEIAAASDPLDSASYPVSIFGTVTYSGLQTGDVRVVAVMDALAWDTNHVCVLAVPGVYSVDVANLGTYWIKAWRDVNSDGIRDETEAWGAYAANPLFADVSTGGVSITLMDVDSDNDGLPDWWEIHCFGNLAESGAGDPDGDGLNNADEYTHQATPFMADSDADGVNDGDEVAVGRSPAEGDTYVLFDDFEESDGFAAGPLNGQEGWSVAPAQEAVVQRNKVRRGIQAVRFSEVNGIASKTLLATGTYVSTSIAACWIPNAEPPTSLPSTVGAMVSFSATNGLVVFDGDGNGGGTWVVVSNTLLVSRWARLGIEQDFTNQTWSLYVDGVERMTGLGFKDNTVTQLNAIHIEGGVGGALHIDDLGITEH